MRATASVAAGRRLLAGRSLRLRGPSPRARRRLIAACALALVLGAGYMFWLRDSSLVAVEEVKVTGLTTEDAERVRNALTIAGRSMTTLHVRRERIEQAMAAYPVVRDVHVGVEFPHGLQLHVVEYRPAAIAKVGGRELPVAADGTVLAGLPVEGRLPEIAVEGGVKGDRLANADALGAARVAGATPGPLRSRVGAIEARADEGLVAVLNEGPELIFGDGSRARAKWLAAARVLADPDAKGATYIDLRLPGRPAAGGLPAATVAPVAPLGESATAPAPAAGAPAPEIPLPGTGVAAPPASQAAPGQAPAPAAPAPGTPPAGTPSVPTAPVPEQGATPPSAGAESVAGGTGAPPG